MKATSSLTKRSPYTVAFFELAQPMSIDLPMSEQLSVLRDDSRLQEITLGSGRFFDLEENEYIGKNLAEMTASSSSNTGELNGIFEHLFVNFIAGEYTLENEHVVQMREEREVHFNISCYGFLQGSYLTKVLVVMLDQTEQYHHDRQISEISRLLQTAGHEDFLHVVVRFIADNLAVDFVSVSDFIDLHRPFRDQAIECRLPQSTIEKLGFHQPTVDTILKGEPCIIAREAGPIFAKDSAHIPELEAFIAVPLLDRNNVVMGALTVMHRQALENADALFSVLNVAAIHVASEIELRRNEMAKFRREQQRQLFIENNNTGMYVADVDPPMPMNLSLAKKVKWLVENAYVSECNQAVVELSGYKEKSDMLGKRLYNPNIQYDYATQARELLTEGYAFQDRIVHIVTEAGIEKWLSINITCLIQNDKLIQIYGLSNDVTDRINRSREMEYKARHDDLTGLANRSYFIEQAQAIITDSAADKKHALFILDLDGFKEVNDTLGHETGDYLLKNIGPRAKPILDKAGAVLARLGGDEFAVFVEDYDNEQAVTELAEKLMGQIKTPFNINELDLVVGGSVGIALYPKHCDSVSSLMRCADVAMYQAKQHSMDYALYSPDNDHYSVRRLSLMMDIRQAVANDELRVFYQPVIDLGSREVISFEALVRWQHPGLGMLSPGEFIPLIELTDMIMPVTWWVLETAVKQIAEWRAQSQYYRIAVNISARNLIDVGFADFIRGCLERYQVDGSLLELEITESTLMADPEKSRQILKHIAELGCGIAIDDYGTGYSSLAYLKSLPINTLKIDREFISQMMEDSQDQIIVRSTVQLAHNLGLDVTAEGIETEALVGQLVELGCDKGQGFHFCRPAPIAQLNDWLQQYQSDKGIDAPAPQIS